MRRVALLVAVAVLAPLTGCGRERRHQVHLSITQIASVAAEGALLADDVARGRTKTTFVRVHGDELSSQVEHEAEKLNDAPVDPAIKGRTQLAVQLAGDIGNAIDNLRTSPGDRGQARTSEANLKHLAVVATTLADRT